MVQKTFNIFYIFNISLVSSTFFNIGKFELTFLTFLQFQAFFGKNARNGWNVKKCFFFCFAAPMVQKTFNIFNIFDISAVSSTFFTSRRGIDIFNISTVWSILGQKTPSSAASVPFISKTLPNCRNTAISQCSQRGLWRAICFFGCYKNAGWKRVRKNPYFRSVILRYKMKERSVSAVPMVLSWNESKISGRDFVPQNLALFLVDFGVVFLFLCQKSGQQIGHDVYIYMAVGPFAAAKYANFSTQNISQSEILRKMTWDCSLGPFFSHKWKKIRTDRVDSHIPTPNLTFPLRESKMIPTGKC